MTIALPIAVEPLIKGVAIRLTTLWEIVRQDGKIRYVTNSDRQITFNNKIYDPDNAVNASATVRNSGLEAHDRTLNGIMSSESIVLNEMQAGLLNGATVIERIIDRKYPWAGQILEKTYFIGATRFSETEWEAEIKTLGSKLDHTVGSIYGRICRFTVGDAKCGVNLSQFATGLLTVSNVSFPCNTRSEFEFTSADYIADHDVGFANFGFATWFSGKNAGFKTEILSEARPGGNIVTLQLLDHAPFDIDLGDTFRVTAGCDRTLTTCRDKFDNLLRFGGFPFMPGIDAAVQQTDAG